MNTDEIEPCLSVRNETEFTRFAVPMKLILLSAESLAPLAAMPPRPISHQPSSAAEKSPGIFIYPS